VAGELAGIRAVVDELLPREIVGKQIRLGVPDPSKTCLVAAIAERNEGPTLLLASTPARAAALMEEAVLYLRDVPVSRLPDREGLPYEFLRDDPRARMDAATALTALRSDGRALVITSWSAFSELRAGPALQRAGVVVNTGTRYAPDELQGSLEACGYSVEPLADAPGTVARRGGIIDVFPVGAEHPARLEYFGDEVESIREVDLSTQRSVRRLERLEMPPAATNADGARTVSRDLLERLEAKSDHADAILEQLALIVEGGHSDYQTFFEPLLYRETALDHLHESSTVVIDDGEAGLAALETSHEHQERARGELEQSRTIPEGLGPLNAEIETFRGQVYQWPNAVGLERFGTDERGARRLELTATPSFGGKVRTLAQQAARWAADGKRVVIASHQALRLSELLGEEGTEADVTRSLEEPPEAGTVTLLPAAVSGGFMMSDDLILVTDEEVFGFQRRRRPRRTAKGIRADLLATLELGQYVVHADHGIAKFGGLTRREVEGVEREYLELQYLEGDRILVPTDQLESVSRYIGPSDGAPRLTRLGSQEWTHATRRVKRAVAEMAQDLLELYAKRELARGTAFPADNAWQMEMEAAFEFVETPDQLEAIREVKADMESEKPMDRLICGDVGYGKTEVAVRAAFKAVMSGKQAAILVPTTVLAEQHGETFRERISASFPVEIAVLSRFRSDAEQKGIVERIKSGDVDIAIGTHRLIQKDVEFKDLGLIIIDEEQRFGVEHKERLKRMREEVDVLSLSATPIPRTLQMSLTGIRDLSSVMSPPEERLPVKTYVTGWDDEIVHEAIDREIQRGGQVYFVHNRVHNMQRIVARLQELVPEADLIVGHGQMPEAQLERVMAEFSGGEHDVLVCTTIIESGLDIPNVNTIIINNANQFGLSQLYQLRGRVGRAASRAYAYLLYDRTTTISEPAQKRLEAIFEASELGAGFQIALRDLEIRGAGNVLGTEQSGQIAAVGFDMYAKLVAEAVEALKRGLHPDAEPAERKLPPAPTMDLPISAAIPERYIPDLNNRLAVYQRIANLSSVQEVDAMQEELRDRFGPVPPLVESLLLVSLLKAVAQRANVERISTSEMTFHVRLRGGTSERQHAAIGRLGDRAVVAGPGQVRIDRAAAGEGWLQLLTRVLRSMDVTPASTQAAG
jgi:transcription-repair coupling factor (superfamily II helicase)